MDWDRSTRMHDSSINRSYSADVLDKQVGEEKIENFKLLGV